MVVPVTEAIIFDCLGVLYAKNRSTFYQYALNTELITFITEKVKSRHKVGLLSNIDREWIDNFLTEHQLEGLFDAVVVSGDEGIAKPHPYIYQRMSELIEVLPGQCLMIDDLQDNCIGAENAGMRSIHFTSNDRLLDDLKKLDIIS